MKATAGDKASAGAAVIRLLRSLIGLYALAGVAAAAGAVDPLSVRGDPPGGGSGPPARRDRRQPEGIAPIP